LRDLFENSKMSEKNEQNDSRQLTLQF